MVEYVTLRGHSGSRVLILYVHVHSHINQSWGAKRYLQGLRSRSQCN